MKIKSIYIRAFRCFEEADIDFSKDGVSANLVAIQAPNGFGKTEIKSLFYIIKNVLKPLLK